MTFVTALSLNKKIINIFNNIINILSLTLTEFFY